MMRAFGKEVRVDFEEGPLGLQLADVNRRVLVTGIETGDDDRPSQAERSGNIEIGHQITCIGGRSCLGLSMRQVLAIMQEESRPMTVTFQPLIIPNFPRNDREVVYSKLSGGNNLVSTGKTYELTFEGRQLGINVGDWKDEKGNNLVVVSQLLHDELSDIQLGDKIISIGTRSESNEWELEMLRNAEYTEIAGRIRAATRPVKLVFERMKIVSPLEIELESKKERKKTRCTSCDKPVYQSANFCWSCGFHLKQENKELIDLDEPQVYSNCESEDLLDFSTPDSELEGLF